jgi:hypothetical protein
LLHPPDNVDAHFRAALSARERIGDRTRERRAGSNGDTGGTSRSRTDHHRADWERVDAGGNDSTSDDAKAVN